MKKYITFILILCILCQCALFSISTNAEEIISGDIQTEEMQFATLEEVLAGLATPDQLPPAYDAFKPQNGQYTTLSSSTGLNFDGIYYINNIYGGAFLTCPTSTSVTPDGRRGLLSTLGNTIKWMIAEVEDGSGIYTIRPMTAYSKYLAFSTGNVYATLSTTLNDYSKWYISTAAHGGIVIQNVGISRYLQSYGDTSFDGTADVNVIQNLPSGTSQNYNSYAWRIINHNQYGSSSGYPKCEMSAQTNINKFECRIGTPKKPKITKQYSNEIWCEASDFWYSIDSSENIISVDLLTGYISGQKIGLYDVVAEHKVTGRCLEFEIQINLLIYQTPNLYVTDAYGKIPDDMKCGDVSQSTLENASWINIDNIADKTITQLRDEWEDSCATFSMGSLESVAMDMIDHFMDGSGTDYSNYTLTEIVRTHSVMINYFDRVSSLILETLDENNGNVFSMQYDVSNRDSNPLIVKLQADEVYMPSFNSIYAYMNGLAFCLHGLWGHEIEVTDFYIHENGDYTVMLAYNIYDHFGLDQNDIDNIKLQLVDNFHPGFSAWYILQHNSEYNCAYKPFVTFMRFSVSIDDPLE